MSVLPWADDFDTGTLSAEYAVEGTPSLSAVAAFSGGYGLALDRNVEYIRLTPSNATSYGVMKVRIKVPNHPFGGDRVLASMRTASEYQYYLSVTAAGGIYVRLYDGVNSVFYNSSLQIGDTNWHILDFLLDASASAHIIKVRLDAVEASWTTGSLGVSTVDRYDLGNSLINVSDAEDLYFDEWRIASTGYPLAYTTTVGKDLSLRYDVRSVVSDTFTPQYNVLAVVSDILTPRYNITVSVFDTFAPMYGVRANISDTFGVVYRDLALVNDQFEVRYYTASTTAITVASAGIALLANTLELTGDNFQARYNAKALTSDSLLIPYNVTTPVSDLLDPRYNVTVGVSDTLGLLWHAWQKVLDDFTLRYNLKKLLHAFFDFELKWGTYRDWDKVVTAEVVWTGNPNDIDIWTKISSEDTSWTR